MESEIRLTLGEQVLRYHVKGGKECNRRDQIEISEWFAGIRWNCLEFIFQLIDHPLDFAESVIGERKTTKFQC
jgi:hypothetical protein